jgi:hypothetical protein
VVELPAAARTARQIDPLLLLLLLLLHVVAAR